MSVHNIKPRGQLSYINLDTSFLLYYKVTTKKVDIARVITEEIRGIAESCSNKPLALPILIIGLCNTDGICVPNSNLKINLSYIHDGDVFRMCMVTTVGGRKAQTPQSPPVSAQAVPFSSKFH